MRFFVGVTLFFLVIAISGHGEAYKILGLFPLPSRSHFVMFERLMIGLADRGHDVYVLSHFPQKSAHPRYTDMSVLGSRPIYVNNISLSLIEEFTYIGMPKFIFEELGVNLCRDVLKHPAAIELKSSKIKFDLVITEIFGSDCFLGFAHLFQVPVISMTSSVALPWSTDRIFNPDNPSYIPTYFLPTVDTLSFRDRFFNVLLSLGTKLGYHFYSTIPSQEIAAEFFGPDLPPLEKLAENTSLLLINSHFSINGARPLNPGFIEVGGLHIRENLKPLPENLEKHLYRKTILFSMGSMVQTETFPKETLRSLLDTFGQLSDYTIIWKGKQEAMPTPIPDNVVFLPWLPQLDILCHPNLKLFISHGGLMGTQEAIHCGVPVLGIPMFADQVFNIANLERRQVAIGMRFEDVSSSKFSTAVAKLLQNEYAENAKMLSRKFKNRPMSPLDTAVFWVEYVIENKGAPELRTMAGSLTWYQYFMVDIAIVVSVCIFSIFYVLRLLLCKLFCKKNDIKRKIE